MGLKQFPILDFQIYNTPHLPFLFKRVFAVFLGPAMTIILMCKDQELSRLFVLYYLFFYFKALPSTYNKFYTMAFYMFTGLKL